MDQRQVSNMDPDILLSFVNMKLRDEFENLYALVRFYDLEQEYLELKLLHHGYRYHQASNQFKAEQAFVTPELCYR